MQGSNDAIDGAALDGHILHIKYDNGKKDSFYMHGTQFSMELYDRAPKEYNTYPATFNPEDWPRELQEVFRDGGSAEIEVRQSFMRITAKGGSYDFSLVESTGSGCLTKNVELSDGENIGMCFMDLEERDGKPRDLWIDNGLRNLIVNGGKGTITVELGSPEETAQWEWEEAKHIMRVSLAHHESDNYEWWNDHTEGKFSQEQYQQLRSEELA